MISPVSSLASPQATGQTPPALNPPAPKKVPPPQDTVQLSQAAKLATGGDADHDGDSH